MNNLVIFGLTEEAELAYYYFQNDSPYTVAAFTADAEYVKDSSFCSLPVIPFLELASFFSLENIDLFIAIGYSKLNDVRRAKYLQAKALGYSFASYVSSRATVLNNWEIGKNCFILENNTIQPFVSIGNNVTLWSGNHIGHHSNVADHCFIASHAVISGYVEIGESCFIGVNATLRDHIKVGEKCVIGAGAILLSDAEKGGVFLGSASERSVIPSTMLKKI